MTPNQARARVLELLALVGLENATERLSALPHELSGGQQQRVFLARALVQAAEIYFMDEPFVGVDAVTETAIVTVLKSLRDLGKTVVVVHHDLQTLADYFDWGLLLNVRQIAIGPIKQVMTSANLKLAYGGRTAYIS